MLPCNDDKSDKEITYEKMKQIQFKIRKSS